MRVFFCACLLWATATAQPVSFHGHISGHHIPGRDSVSVDFWSDYIHFSGGFGARHFIVPIDHLGRFSFTLPRLDHPGRLSIYYHFATHCYYQLVEPGDSVAVEFHFDNSELTPIFTGQGADKYNLMQAVNNMTVPDTLPSNCLEKAKAYDKWLQTRLSVIRKVIAHLTPVAASILQADIIGSVYTLLALNIQYADSIQQTEWQTLPDSLVFPSILPNSYDSAIFYSTEYIYFLNFYAQLKVSLDTHQRRAALSKVYDFIDQHTSGKTREKSLAYCLLNTFNLTVTMNGCDPDVYRQKFEHALSSVTDSSLKEALRDEYRLSVKGASGFDLAFKDAVGRVRHLHDYRGKIVLVDFWSIPCGGCLQFKQFFSQKVLPFVAPLSDFAVISIAAETSPVKWQKNLKIYSEPAFINLCTRQPLLEDAMSKFYHIRALPHVMLFDRQGRVVSSTIPVEGDGTTLLALINDALAK